MLQDYLKQGIKINIINKEHVDVMSFLIELSEQKHWFYSAPAKTHNLTLTSKYLIFFFTVKGMKDKKKSMDCSRLKCTKEILNCCILYQERLLYKGHYWNKRRNENIDCILDDNIILVLNFLNLKTCFQEINTNILEINEHNYVQLLKHSLEKIQNIYRENNKAIWQSVKIR